MGCTKEFANFENLGRYFFPRQSFKKMHRWSLKFRNIRLKFLGFCRRHRSALMKGPREKLSTHKLKPACIPGEGFTLEKPRMLLANILVNGK